MVKSLGEGIYSASRQDGILHVRAVGHKPALQVKVTLEQLPFLIYPPEIGLFFESADIVSPVVVPFEIERAFPAYPASARSVTIIDRNGSHAIVIVEQTSPADDAFDLSKDRFVVYRALIGDRYLIAKEGALVVGIYVKVFGPDTYEHCKAYVAAHAPPVQVDIVPGTLSAWIDKQPGVQNGSKLIVVVDAWLEVDWKVELVAAVPQGINLAIKLLKFNVQLPPGPVHSHAFVRRTLRYEETPAGFNYTEVTIENGSASTSAVVTIVS